jgi:hypothetical protein
MIFVPRAAVSIVGGIQPRTLRRYLGVEHIENGLLARLLVVAPPRISKRWSEATVDPQLVQAVERVFGRLLALDFGVDDNDKPAPVGLQLIPEAKDAWVGFYNAHAAQQAELTGELAAAWSKLEAYAARFALVVHLVRVAADDPTAGPEVVDTASLSAGIALARWFGHEAGRVYGMLAETDEERERRRLVESIERKGGRVMAREVQQGNRRFRTAAEAEEALAELATAGLGCWEPTPPGRRGRPTRRFVLSTVSRVYDNSPTPDENCDTVDVDSVDGAESQSPHDKWGEV